MKSAVKDLIIKSDGILGTNIKGTLVSDVFQLLGSDACDPLQEDGNTEGMDYAVIPGQPDESFL